MASFFETAIYSLWTMDETQDCFCILLLNFKRRSTLTAQARNVHRLLFSSCFGFLCSRTGRTARPIWINEGWKRVVLHKDVPFRGLNDVPLNFGVRLRKSDMGVNRTFRPEQQQNSHLYRTTKPMMTKFLQGLRSVAWHSWCVIHGAA